jgi:peptide/nickel transport system substrate-binding protein
MFNPLVTLDKNLQPAPYLAESWTFSDDRQRLTFKLRQGVTFHSGRSLTADAVKWNIEHAQDPGSQSAVGAELSGVQARAADATTLELTLPDPSFPQIFSLLTNILIADPQSDIALNAAGTGAFELDALDPGNAMRLVRNPNYWRSDRPFLGEVNFDTFHDPQAAMAALETGTAGIVPCPASEFQRLKAGTATTAIDLRASGSYEFLISAVDEPFTDKRVRQAINLALDRRRFAETLMYGLTDPTYILWLKGSPAWDASIDTGEFDLDKAQQLLTDAGYGAGFETKIQTNSAYPELMRFAEVVQSDLAKIGVKLSIEPMEAVQANAAVAQARFPALMTHIFGYGDQDPALQFTAFVFRPSGNASRFQSDLYSQMVDAARRERDPARRLGLYRQIAVFLQDAAFELPIANAISPYGVRSNVQGIARQPLAGAPILEDIWLS